eukprot:Hpha_TRINITY_DN9689_c0_g2::TRINITY_DN9689_c0_g2_i1::g.184451::m.184451
MPGEFPRGGARNRTRSPYEGASAVAASRGRSRTPTPHTSPRSVSPCRVERQRSDAAEVPRRPSGTQRRQGGALARSRSEGNSAAHRSTKAWAKHRNEVRRGLNIGIPTHAARTSPTARAGRTSPSGRAPRRVPSELPRTRLLVLTTSEGEDPGVSYRTSKRGVVVTSVRPSSAAAAAGLATGQELIAVGGARVGTAPEADTAFRLSGAQVTVMVAEAAQPHQSAPSSPKKTSEPAAAEPAVPSEADQPPPPGPL